MIQTDSGGSSVKAGREHRGWGFPLVAVISIVLGIVGIIPFVIAVYAVEQLLLAPLGLAPVDPTNNDGAAGLVIFGIGAPLVVAASWAAAAAAVVRGFGLGRCGWAVAVAGVAAPTIAFAASKLA